MGRFYSNSAFDKFRGAAGRARPHGAAVCFAAVLLVLFCFASQASAMSAREFYRYAKKYKCQNPFAARKPVYNKSSVEHVGNRNVKRVSAFRKYSSTKAFLKDYAKKIREDYPQSAKQKDNVWLYFAGLYKGRHGKWATDRNYYSKLVTKAVKIAPQIYGSKWKTKLRSQFKKAQKRLEPWQAQAVRKAIG